MGKVEDPGIAIVDILRLGRAQALLSLLYLL
jgi:hypothetical protein